MESTTVSTVVLSWDWRTKVESSTIILQSGVDCLDTQPSADWFGRDFVTNTKRFLFTTVVDSCRIEPKTGYTFANRSRSYLMQIASDQRKSRQAVEQLD